MYKYILIILTAVNVTISAATDGTLAWKSFLDTSTGHDVGSPAIKANGTNSSVLALAGDTVTSLKYNNGTVNWNVSYNNSIHSVILNASKSLVYFNKGWQTGSGDGGVYCLTEASGIQVWHFEGVHNGSEYNFSDRIALGIDYNGADLIYALGLKEGNTNYLPVLWCIDSYGSEKWKRADFTETIGGGIGWNGDISIGSNGQVYVTTLNTVYRFHGQWGYTDWTYNVSPLDQKRIGSPIAIDNSGNLYFYVYDTTVNSTRTYLMSLTSSGVFRWETELGDLPHSSLQEPVVGSDGTVYATASEITGSGSYPLIFALNTSNGSIKWDQDFDNGPYIDAMTLDDSGNLIYGRYGEIVSIDTQTGSNVNWTFTDGGALQSLSSGINIDNGYLYFTTNTHIYALNYSKDIQLGNWPKMQKAIKSQSYKGSSYQ